MDDDQLAGVLEETAKAVRGALDRLAPEDWRRPGTRPGQYHLDLVADAAALEVLHGAGLGVFSEESGASGPDGRPVVVVDPVDGSTNASVGFPWFATSLCVLDEDGPRVALVVNQVLGTRYEARRGRGATRDGRPIAVSGRTELDRAVIGVSGLPHGRPPWWQTRALGSAALDLCLVAEGVLDGFSVGATSSLRAWDYLGALLVCREAGAVVWEADARELVVVSDSPRRVVAAGSTAVAERLLGVLNSGVPDTRASVAP